MIFNINNIEEKLSVKEIRKDVALDQVLKKVMEYTKKGWPEKNPLHRDYIGFYRKRLELHVENEMLFWGPRLIIPMSWQHRVLHLLHEGHPGMTRMKALARSYYWWPSMDVDIESIVQECSSCQDSRNLKQAEYSPWPETKRPWQRVHIDFAGPFRGHMFLILVDAHSKWLEVKQMGSTTTSKTISQLEEIFITHGLPETLVSDNGTNFASEEMAVFMNKNGIIHLFSPPYHPASNGIAERAVQTFKKTIGRTVGEGCLVEIINRFLLTYRITPHTSTGKAPCELLMGRKIRSKLNLLFPYEPIVNETRSEAKKRI